MTAEAEIVSDGVGDFEVSAEDEREFIGEFDAVIENVTLGDVVAV
jgi:hypothetical protein